MISPRPIASWQHMGINACVERATPCLSSGTRVSSEAESAMLAFVRCVPLCNDRVRVLPKPNVSGSRHLFIYMEQWIIQSMIVRSVDQRGPSALHVAERGDPVETRALAVRLAHEVLSAPAVTLAHELLGGGPYATAKAIELAEHLKKNASPSLAALPVASAKQEVL